MLPRISRVLPARRNKRVRRLVLHQFPQGAVVGGFGCPQSWPLMGLTHFSLLAQWGLVNFDASTLWVRNRKHLTDALDITPEFLRTKHGDAGE
jgi:hypothetical protein